MGMTDKQFNSYIHLILNVIAKALKKMPESEEKEDLKNLAENNRGLTANKKYRGVYRSDIYCNYIFSMNFIDLTAKQKPCLKPSL